MRAPFPYQGGKSTIAAEVWRRLGNPKGGYVEPFAGSLAVLLARPDWRPDGPRLIETVNDACGLLANFWRAMARDEGEVWAHADWPPNEVDLRARYAWLTAKAPMLPQLLEDPEWCDPKAAGWWVWAMAGSAIPRAAFTEKASVALRGSKQQGIIAAREQGYAALWLRDVAARLRLVRVRCGDWSRCVQSPSMRGSAEGPWGIFLDPPYADTNAAYDTSTGVEREVWEWACANGDNPLLRIVVAGYEDGRVVPPGWDAVEWSGPGGMARRGSSGVVENRHNERLWCSPNCLKPPQMALGL